MSGWNKLAASVGLVLVLAGIGALYSLAGDQDVRWYWWAGAFALLGVGVVILGIELVQMHRQRTDAAAPKQPAGRKWRSKSWESGRSRTEWEEGGATATESHDTDAVVVDHPLTVSVERPEWTRLRNTVLVLRVKVTVTNQTDQQKRLGGPIFRATDGIMAMADQLGTDLMREVDAIGATAYPMPGVVGPHDSVSGWYVYTFRDQPLGGSPEYEIGVEDELKNIYWKRIPKEPAKGWDPSQPLGLPGWKSRIEHVLPSGQFPAHGLMAKLIGPEGKPAEGKVKILLRLGPNIIREEEAKFDDYYLQPGERPHYSTILFNPFRPEGRLDDGLYELRWIGEHALGHRDMAEPHQFEIRQGALVTNV